MEEAVLQLSDVLEAYEKRSRSTSSTSSTTDKAAIFDLLDLAACIWPTIVPDSLLVKLWMLVKSETLKQFLSCGNELMEYNYAVLCDNEMNIKLIQAINVFLSQCPHLPFDVFWEECVYTFLQISDHEELDVAFCTFYNARQILQGLLHLMALNCAHRNPFLESHHEEASIARLFILVRLVLEKDEAADEHVIDVLLPKEDSYRTLSIVRFGFQVIIKLFQGEAVHKLGLIEPAWHLLEYLDRENGDEWIGCLASLLQQILQAYLEKGPTFLEKPPTKTLLRLFSQPCFTQTFLDCITHQADPHRSSASGLSAAFQIFELVYQKHVDTMLKSCLRKAVDEQSDRVLLRLQCLNLIGKIQTYKCTFSEDARGFCNLWTEDCIRDLLTVILRDSSIRVRRSAMQIFMHLSLSEIINEEEMLKICLMKVRDQDEKIRFMALQILSKLSLKSLAECLSEKDWIIICKSGFSEQKKELQELFEGFLLKYVTTEFLAESPSTRLQTLGLIGQGDWSKQPHFSFLYKHVEEVFEREMEYLDAF